MAHPSHQRDADARASESPYVAASPTGDPTDDTDPRPTRSRRSRALRLALPVAVLATAGSVTVGVLSAGADDPAGAASSDAAATSGAASVGDIAARRVRSASRSDARAPAARPRDDRSTLADNPRKLEVAMDRTERRVVTRRVVRRADTKRWTTTDLNIWTLPGDRARNVGLLDSRTKVLVTAREQYGRQEVVLDGASRWVTAGYLATEKPAPPQPAVSSSGSSGSSSGSSSESAPSAVGGACTNGTSVSPGVSPNIVAVHEAVCASFPEITTYGDFRGDGEHAQGIALDIMVSGARGQQVADFVRANAAELGVSYVIHAQRIWSVQRSGEGWRGMEDRGSTTANHYDHVHVTTY